METLQKVWRTEGVKGLFAGNGTNILRIFPTSALVCLVYSRMIKVCRAICPFQIFTHYLFTFLRTPIKPYNAYYKLQYLQNIQQY